MIDIIYGFIDCLPFFIRLHFLNPEFPLVVFHSDCVIITDAIIAVPMCASEIHTSLHTRCMFRTDTAFTCIAPGVRHCLLPTQTIVSEDLLRF